MAIQELLAAGAALGYKADGAAHTLSGLEAGIAFLVRLDAGTLEMSVNIPDKNLPKLQARVAQGDAAFAAVTVERYGFGIRLTLPQSEALSPATLERWIRLSAGEAAVLIGVSHTDKFEKDGEPVSAYVRGLLGALLGALVGILPWILVSELLHIRSWYLGFAISIASFYGYSYLRGAHHTTFAVTVIAIFSLAVMVLPGAVELVLWGMQSELKLSFAQAVAYAFRPQNLLSSLPSMGFGLIANIVGLVSIRGRVLAYTHETQFLRRSRRRPKD